MKYLKVLLQPIKIKGSEDDMDTLRADLYEQVAAMMESDSLEFEIADEEEDDDSD